jgi:hypothetical protein
MFLLPNECHQVQKSEILKIQAENAELRAKLDASLECNAKLSAQMQDLQEKLDIVIKQFNKQNKKQHDSKNEHHNPRQAPGDADELGDSETIQPASSGGAASPVKKFSRRK